MTYSGDVVVGGPPDRRDVSGLTIRKIAIGPMHNNVYLLTCRTTGEQLLIDPAADPAALIAFIRSGSTAGSRTESAAGSTAGSSPGSACVPLGQIVVTHSHADHIGALAPLADATGARILCGADDAAAIETQTGVRVTTHLRQGDVVRVGNHALSVIHLRGHTPGSVALAYTEASGPVHIFTGDSLFPGGVGKTGSTADFTSLLTDVRDRIFTPYDDGSWIYPGHGSDTTLGAQRGALEDWAARGW